LSTDTRVATVQDSVIIPVGSNYAYFRMTAQDTVGTIQIQATATGYAPVNTTLRVTEPKFVVSTAGTVTTTTPPQRLTIYATDDAGTAHPVVENVTITLSSSAPGVANTDSTTVTMRQGEYYTHAAHVRYFSPGQATITASDSRTASYRYNPGSVTVTVNTPPVHLGFSTMTLGVGQTETNGLSYVSVDNTAQDTITVTLTHVGSAETSTPTTVKILPGTNYAYFRTVANAIGRDTVIASAPGHRPDTGFVDVGTGTLTISNWSSSVANNSTRSLTLRTLDQAGGEHSVNASTTFTLTPSNSSIAFYATSSSTTPITSITVPADASSVTFYMKATNATGSNVGSGVTISGTNYTTYTNTVTVTP
jgi:hypothetical protein